MIGKQAKTLSAAQTQELLSFVAGGRHPERDRVVLLLSFKAGLRAKEICALTWSMVTDVEGEISGEIALPNPATKGKSGRIIPIHRELASALQQLRTRYPSLAQVRSPVVYPDRRPGEFQRPGTLVVWFHSLYRRIGFDGASSHSGRRTFITQAARKISAAGGSLRDVQQLAGHASLTMTQRYIEGSSDAMRRVIDAM
jgi:integrase/recombinase XerC